MIPELIITILMLARTLASASVTASLLAGDVVLLTLFLNPDASLRRESLPLFVSIFLPYAAFAGIGFLAMALLATGLGPRIAKPPVEGLPWFTSLATLAVLSASALFWLNLIGYRYSIPVEFVRALFASSVLLGLAGLVLLGAGLDALFFPTRGRALSAPVVVLTAASAVVVPLLLRPVPVPAVRPLPVATEIAEPVRRVILIGIDGLGPTQVDDGLSRGKLPVFAGLVKRGAHGPLASFRPTEGPPIWTSIFTGRLPRDHGVKSFASYRLRLSDTAWELLPKGALVGGLERLGFVSMSPVTAASRKCRALWDALNAFGIRTGVVRFWGTHPPEHVQGFMLSNYFHLLRHDAARASESLYPPDMIAQLSKRAVAPADVDRALIGQFVDLSMEAPDDSAWRRDLVELALAPDLTYQRAGAVLRGAYDPPFFANYFYGLDVVGHAFTRYAQPDRFGDVRPADARRYGRVVDRYAAFLSQWVGEIEKGLRPGEILLVVSGYGMEPVPWWRRLLAASFGAKALSGTHEAAPDGYFFAVGDGVKPGAVVARGSVLDIAPTVLYLMGLPVARDMEGRVLTEILDDEFARAHPVALIPSYESLAITPISALPESDVPPLPDEVP
jgi:predicted AlkP superfamily phosphohydrolase/phosphomutase